jgi:hypothetical protein
MARTVAAERAGRKGRNRDRASQRIESRIADVEGDTRMVTRRSISSTVVLAVASLLLLVSASLATAKGGPKMLEFQTMVGVPQAFTGDTNAPVIRGVNGGGIPWRLDLGKGELSTGGHLEIKVRGLVLASGANAGTNPVANFRGLVSCLTDTAAVVNVPTGNFPATTGPASAGGGNADIEVDLDLPNPCIAPIVFVTSPGGAWFASTGG